jgi:alkylresorcinol/alkylpyrone synthase
VQGGIAVGDVDALVVCTCTGYICPGISSYLSELVGIKV